MDRRAPTRDAAGVYDPTLQGTVAATARELARARRDDLLELPLLALAWRTLPLAPRAARVLARAAALEPRAMALVDILLGERQRTRSPSNAAPDAFVRAAWPALVALAPITRTPLEGPVNAAALVAFAGAHGLGDLLASPPIALARGAFGPLPDSDLPPRHVATVRAALDLRATLDCDPVQLFAEVLVAEADIVRAERHALAARYPIVASGPHAHERVAWIKDAVARLTAGADRGRDRWLLDEERYFRAELASRGMIYVEEGARVREVVQVSPHDPWADVDLADAATRRAVWLVVDIANQPAFAEQAWVEQQFVPRHAALLHALAQLAPQADAREERVAWIVKALPPYATLEPVLQRATKGGAFTKGTRVHARDITTGKVACATAQDRAAAALMVNSSMNGTEVLRALQGHPLLLDKARVAWTVDAKPAEVSIDEVAANDPGPGGSGGGFRVRVHVGGHTITPPPASAWSDTPVTLVDNEQRVVTFVELTPPQLALARAAAVSPVIPRAAGDELMKIVERLERVPHVALAPSLQGEPVAPDERVIVRLDPEGTTLCARVGFRPIASGTLLPPALGPVEVAGLVADKRVRTVRVFDTELARARALRERLPLPELEVEHEWQLRATTPDTALALVERLQALADEGTCVVEWKDARPALVMRGTVQAQSLKLRVRGIAEWLGVDGEAEVNGELVSLGALLEAVRNGRRYVQLSKEKFVALSSELRARVQPIAAFSQPVEADGAARTVEIAPSLAGALSDLHDDGARFADTDAWHDVARRAAAARLATDEPPAGLLADLRPYQRAGVRFLRRLAAWETGGVLADDMGLGKTVQATALLVERARIGPQLVLAPTSVCFNWQRELVRFAPSLRVHALADAPAAANAVDARRALVTSLGPHDVLVVGYGLAVTSAEAFSGVRFASVILDEAQAVKNADTLRARIARDLQSPFKVALTGTPLENHLGELWSLFRVVSPALFGSHERFRARYAIPIERDRSLEKRRELAQALRPFLLRRTKDEVLTELPARTEIVQTIELSADERVRYDATRAAVLADALADDALAPRDRRFRVLAGLTRLRLLACHARLVDEHAPNGSAKLTAIVRTVCDLKENKHRALVFSQFVKHLALVRPALEEAGVRTLQLDGSTPAPERAKLVDRFQSGAADVFLLSLKAGGAGLNLTAADYVLHLDPWWNPAVEDQATGRAHRIGQEKPVTVYRFVARGTIEEQMVALHAEKRDLVDGVLEGADAAGSLSVDDLVALLRA